MIRFGGRWMKNNLLFSSLLLAVSSSLLAAQRLPISKPEDLAGRWETSDGHGGMVGMNVIVSTHIDGTPVSLIGHREYLDSLDIGLYQRTGPDVEQSSVSTSSRLAQMAARFGMASSLECLLVREEIFRRSR